MNDFRNGSEISTLSCTLRVAEVRAVRARPRNGSSGKAAAFGTPYVALEAL